jgi:hypothetical protein
MGALLPLLMLAGAAPIAEINDARIAAIDAAPFDREAKMFKHDVLGINRGMKVIADYPCSDLCPTDTVRIIHYDRAPGPDCEKAGGVTRDRTVPFSIAFTNRPYCVPKVLDKRK